MLETPKALGTIIISENPKGCYNGQSAGNQSNLLKLRVGSSETRCESRNNGMI